MKQSRRVLQSSSFSAQFGKKPASLSQADVKVTVAPRKTKKNKFALSAMPTDQAFWEELRDSKTASPGTPKKTFVKARSFQSDSPSKSQALDVGLVTQASVTPSAATATDMMSISHEGLPVMRNPIAKFLEPGQSLLELHPQILAVQEDIVKAKSAAEVLILSDANRGKLASLHAGTALHRATALALKKGSKTHSELVKADHRFTALIEDVGQLVVNHQLGSVALSHVLWSLVRFDLACTVAWFPRLIDEVLSTMAENPESVPLETIGSNLFCLAELHRRLPLAGPQIQLKDALLSVAAAHSANASVGTHQLVSICTSIARMSGNPGAAEKQLLRAVADRVTTSLSSLSVDDVTSTLWAFTKLRLVDASLFSKIQQSLESGLANECTKRNLVDLVWSLAKARPSTADESLTELFRFTLAPLIRRHMQELTVRELCTVLWSFATAEVTDVEFYNDVAHALVPQAAQMNAHDVSSVIWGLASVQYANSDFFKSLKHQTLQVMNDFSPLQLSRVIYGLGAAGVKDKRVFDQLTEAAKKRMHLLYTQNIVEILVGLSSVGLVDNVGPFLQALESQTSKVSGRDAVQVLKVLGMMETVNPGIVYREHREVLTALEAIVTERFNCTGRWIPNGFDLVDLLQAAADLRLSNPEMLEPVILHLSTVYKSPSFTADLFLRFLSAVSSFPPNGEQMRLLKKLLLLKEKGIAVAMEKLSGYLLNRSGSLAVEGAIDVFVMYGKIAYQDEHVMRLAELLSQTNLAPVTLVKRVELATALAQLQLMPDFAFSVVEHLTREVQEGHNGNTLPADSVLDLVWARLALAGDPDEVPDWLLDKIAASYSADEWMPLNLFRAKQVCLSFQDRQTASEAFKAFSADILGVRPGKRSPSPVTKSSKSLIKAIDKYESLICFSLGQLGVKYTQQMHAVPHCYSVTASIGERTAVDLVGPSDVVAPQGERWTGTKILKNLHLAKHGWTLVNPTMRQIQTAMEANSLTPTVADLIAAHHEKAKARTSFRPIVGKTAEKVVDQFLASK